MPEIRGFQAWRYNPSKVGSLSKAYAPPYDVIGKAEQAKLYRASPYNVIRLELGLERAGDSARNNKYTRAARFLSDWKKSGVLMREGSPAVYVHAQDYKEDGRRVTRLGFFAAMKINEREVLRHENTLAAPKKDRLALLKEVRTNLSPIFGLFEDPQGRVNALLRKTLSSRPEIDVTLAGVRHRVYVATDPRALADLSALMKKKPMFIADGHHRFEVACQFKRWMESRRADGDASWHYVMTYFADCANNPFKIFPTHRLLRHPKGARAAMESLSKRGSIRKAKSLSEVLSKLSKNRRETRDRRYTFGLYTKGEGFFLLTLDDRWTRGETSHPVRSLDVSVLHRHLVEPCFGIKAIEKSEAIDFTRDAAEAVRRVNAGDFDMAVFLRPTSLKEMIIASKKGFKMPQKSTYFYPKLLSGLVLHSFE